MIAGVVGAQKPLYDIWGDTVNVASRMDYTGVKGHIQVQNYRLFGQSDLSNIFFALQVTEATADCLRGQNIQCTFRDIIAVKGKGRMPVYFVDLTEEDNLNIEVPDLER